MMTSVDSIRASNKKRMNDDRNKKKEGRDAEEIVRGIYQRNHQGEGTKMEEK